MTVLVYAKKTDKVLAIKTKLVEALNKSNVLSNAVNKATTTIEDDEIDIPKPSFETDDEIPIPKPSLDTADDTSGPGEEPNAETEELSVQDIKLGRPVKSAGDGIITGYIEISDKEKLESIPGLKDGDVLAFVASPDAEFDISVMTEDDGDEE